MSRDLPQWLHAPRRPVSGLVGDHLGVQLLLRTPQPPVRGPGAWVLPRALLSCDEYKVAVQRLIGEVLSQPLSLFQASHAQRYVHLKGRLRQVSMLWGQRVAAEKRAARRVLSMSVDRALEKVEARPDCPELLAAFRVVRAELQACESERAAKIALHAGLVDQHIGERSTHWFLPGGQDQGSAVLLSRHPSRPL